MNRASYARKLFVGMSLMLMLSGIFGFLLSGFGHSGPDLLIEDLSSSSSSGQGVLDLTFSSMSVDGGTGLGCPEWFFDVFSMGTIIITLGTISTHRKETHAPKHLRERIVDEIGSNPGIHLRELHRSIGCAMGALQYHLKNLEREGSVVSVRNGNSRHLFDPGFSSDEQVLKLASYIRNPTIRLILSECMLNGRITQAELSRTLSLDKSLISYYVNGLIKADVLHTVKVFGRERPIVLSSWAQASLSGHNLLSK